MVIPSNAQNGILAHIMLILLHSPHKQTLNNQSAPSRGDCGIGWCHIFQSNPETSDPLIVAHFTKAMFLYRPFSLGIVFTIVSNIKQWTQM